MIPQAFTQSPTEAAIWSAAVGTQSQIAAFIKASPVFLAAVGFAVGLALIMCLWRVGTGTSAIHAFVRFALTLATIAVGMSFLSRQSAGPFSPVNAKGTAWRTVARVSHNPKYSGLARESQGLFWYTTFHKAANELSDLVTRSVTFVLDDPWNRQAPGYMLNALADTARVTLDDPEIEKSFQKLAVECADTKRGAVLGSKDSLASLFNLEDPTCRGEYASLQRRLKEWAAQKRPERLRSIPSSVMPSAFGSMGLGDASLVDNKMIASAIRKLARQKAGEVYDNHNTNAQALIGGTDFWVNVSKTFSADGAFSAWNGARGLFGLNPVDLEGASARNEAAVLYNRLLSFLPAIRGFAKAILAYAWIPASVGLCFGMTGLFYGWLRMLALFTLYEPLSATLYGFTTKMIATTENVNAMHSLAVDPMVLAGAATVDFNLARIELVYFVLQLGLIAICGLAGIKSFAPIHSIRHSYFGDIVRTTAQAAMSAVSLRHFRMPMPQMRSAVRSEFGGKGEA